MLAVVKGRATRVLVNWFFDRPLRSKDMTSSWWRSKISTLQSYNRRCGVWDSKYDLIYELWPGRRSSCVKFGHQRRIRTEDMILLRRDHLDYCDAIVEVG